jgi:hypothetical protein
MENKVVTSILNGVLGSVMKSHGFKRKDRVYYKETNGIVFLLGTQAVGNYFAQVTGFPSHTFSLVEGFWIPEIDYRNTQVNPVSSDIQLPDIFATNTVFHINDRSDGHILRKAPKPYLYLHLNNPAEMERTDLWLLPDDDEEQCMLLDELRQQVTDCFLDKYEMIANDRSKLKEYTIDKLRQYNIERGYDENKPFVSDSYCGNYRHYLDYAVLFYKKFGPAELYNQYAALLNKWQNANPCLK